MIIIIVLFGEDMLNLTCYVANLLVTKSIQDVSLTWEKSLFLRNMCYKSNSICRWETDLIREPQEHFVIFILQFNTSTITTIQLKQ